VAETETVSEGGEEGRLAGEPDPADDKDEDDDDDEEEGREDSGVDAALGRVSSLSR